MSFWDTHGVDVANLERLGPWADVVCGTEGRSTDLNQLYADGARTIILAPGAILTAKLTIAANCTIWSPHYGTKINLGAYGIEVTGGTSFFAGFQINGATGSGIEVSGGRMSGERLYVRGCSSHGIHLNVTANDMEFDRVECRANGGDGIRNESVAGKIRCCNSFLWNNTGWGYNDLSNSAVLFGNRISGNTAGNINGTPALDHNVA